MDKYIVIDAKDIADIKEPIFGKRYAEKEDYIELLQQMQDKFEEFETTGEIQAPEYKKIDDVMKKRQEVKDYNNFMRTFVSIANRITVRLEDDGKYHPVTDGAHRLYTAKKCGLKVLVSVVD